MTRRREVRLLLVCALFSALASCTDPITPVVGAALTWSSSADSVVTVTSGGVVTAAGNGNATIMATSGAASAQIAASVA